VFVLFLAIPYLVVLPLAQWLWFARRRVHGTLRLQVGRGKAADLRETA